MQSKILSELKAAHQIIKNALAVMTVAQKSEWAQRNDADGLVDLGATRAHEREAAISEAEQ